MSSRERGTHVNAAVGTRAVAHGSTFDRGRSAGASSAMAVSLDRQLIVAGGYCQKPATDKVGNEGPFSRQGLAATLHDMGGRGADWRESSNSG
jgi:hypothetical protein